MWKFGILGMIAYKIKVQRNYRKFILNIYNVIIISFVRQEYNQENKEKFKVKIQRHWKTYQEIRKGKMGNFKMRKHNKDLFHFPLPSSQIDCRVLIDPVLENS